MWIKATGDLTENLSQVTTAISTHFLAFGEKSALVDAAIWQVREELWDKVSTSAGTIDYILLTHAHFDHVGAIPFLREKAPHLKLVSGRLAADLLSNKEYVEILRKKNDDASKASGLKMECSKLDFYKALQVDEVLSEGDIINLGEGIEVKLFESPGHTEDSVCYYFKPDMALAAGEALGQYSGREKITPSFGFSFEEAMKSYQKLNAFDIHLLSLPHSGVLSGDLVPRYLTALPVEMEHCKSLFQQKIEEGILIEEIAGNVSADWLEEGRLPEGPFVDAHRELIEKMVRNSRTN